MVLGDGWKSLGNRGKPPPPTSGRLQIAARFDTRDARAGGGRCAARRTDSRARGADRAERSGIVVSLRSADLLGGENSEGHCARSVAAGSIPQAGGSDPFGGGAAGCAANRSFRRCGVGSGRPDPGGEGKIRGRFLRFRTRHQASSRSAGTCTITPWRWCAPTGSTMRRSEAEMAVRADASLVEAHELLGGLHARKKELPEAAREYRAALALKPDLARVHLRLGTVLAAAGDQGGSGAPFPRGGEG